MQSPLRVRCGRLQQLLLLTLLVALYAHGVQSKRGLKQSVDSGSAPAAAIPQRQAQRGQRRSSAAGSSSTGRSSSYSSYEDYTLETLGERFDDPDGDLYFNSKTGMLDDVYGDYFFGQPEEHSSCKLGADGTPILDGAYKQMCDIQVTGANAQVPLLAGGLDGIYRVHTCENGRPAFRRITNPDGEDRLLWYSSKHKDWDISNGTKPEEMDILLYGGEGMASLRPEFVPQDKWFIAAEFQPNATVSADYIRADVLVQCTSKHREVTQPPETVKEHPYITAAEMEAQYRSVIDKAARQRQRHSSNSFFSSGTIALLVVLGVILCLCLPRALANRNIAKRRRGDGKGGWIGLTQLGGRQPVAQD